MIRKPLSSYTGILEETSALSYYEEGVLLTVQDESGKVYFLNSDTGEILREIKFGKGGDYEGIEVIGDTVWVMKSNGDFYYFSILDDKVQAQELTTSFESSNNLEGLGVLGAKLLVACKGEGSLKNNNQKGKGIYLMDNQSVEPYLFCSEKRAQCFH